MVKPGFKQTELGEIPEDWDISPLNEYATAEGGYAFSSKKFKQEGIYQVIKMSNLYGGHLNLDRSSSFINQLVPQEERYLINSQNILITLTGTVGKTDYGYSHTIRNEENLLLNQRVARIIVDNKKADPFYIGYMFKTPTFLKQFFDCSKGGTGNQTNVSTIDLLKIRIPQPIDLKEQKKISEALSDVDELIVSLEKLIAKKQDIKTATMQQLLTGKKRLPGFGEGKGYKQTELGQIPEDWILQPIGLSFEFKNGLNKEKKYFGYGTPIINYMDVYQHSGLKACDIAGKVDVSSEEQRAYSAKKGDVFFTRTSETVDEIGVACSLLEDIEKAVFSGFVLRARPCNDIFEDTFKQYCFGNNIVRKQIMSTSSYTTRALTNGRLLSNVLIPLPKTKKEQSSIALVISNMDQDLAFIGAKLSKAKAIKQGMMQELLTGKTRLV